MKFRGGGGRPLLSRCPLVCQKTADEKIADHPLRSNRGCPPHFLVYALPRTLPNSWRSTSCNGILSPIAPDANASGRAICIE